MNKFFIILIHTYVNRLKSKAFLITTAVSLLLVIGLTNINSIIDSFSGEDEAKKIAVIDNSGAFFPLLEDQLIAQQAEIEVVSYTKTEEKAKAAVQDGDYDGYLHLTKTAEGLPQGTYFANSIAESNVSGKIQQGLQQIKVIAATEQAGINQTTVEQIYAPVSFEKKALSENAKTEKELDEARGLVYIMLFLLYMGVIMYGNMIATEVATEKSSRVMEILISSVSPVKQMFGKILGIALLGVTQFGLILVVGYQSVQSNLNNLQQGVISQFGLSDINISTLIFAIVFFLLGYLLYATLAAVLGSLVSRIEDAQQVVTPMIILIVIVFMVAMYGIYNPEAQLITVTSFIPFFTPMVMFLRVGMLDIPAWEVGIAIVLLMTTIVLLGIIGGRIYRGGVLLYGRSSSIKDIKKAMQLSKKTS